MTTIRLTEDQIIFLQGVSTQVICGNDVYYYIPYWYKEVEEGVYEELSLDNLPKELIDEVKSQREKQTDGVINNACYPDSNYPTSYPLGL